MKKVTIGIVIVAIIVTIGQLAIIDYSDLSWSKNAGCYLGIISIVLLLVSLIYSNKYEKKKHN